MAASVFLSHPVFHEGRNMCMARWIRFAAVAISVSVLASMAAALPQQPAIVAADDLNKVVPTGFYFEGQVGPTQMRNAAAVRFGANRHFVAALVDTSGYASSVRSKYEGFLITDEAVTLGGAEIKAGAYGFGFTEDLKMNIFDIGGKKIHALPAAKDEKLTAPRPLNIVQEGKSYRLYKGRTYVTLTMK
jgi:hypothetical protein